MVARVLLRILLSACQGVAKEFTVSSDMLSSMLRFLTVVAMALLQCSEFRAFYAVAKVLWVVATVLQKEFEKIYAVH